MTNLDGIPVWMINLDRATTRRQNMERQLEAIGLNYSRFSATDGRANWQDLKGTVDIDAFERNVGRSVLPGEIGASHSHFAVWKKIEQSGAEFGLVLEDDVVFHDDFLNALDVAIAAKDQWDFLKLNKIRAKIPLCQTKRGDWCFNAYLGPCTGLGAYLIKADLIQRVMPAFLPICRPIDRELDRLHVHRFRHIGLEPFPSHVDDGSVSTITGTDFNEVQKRPAHQRLEDYASRITTSVGKLMWLTRSGQLRAGLKNRLLR